jgi:hypothetical protein
MVLKRLNSLRVLALFLMFCTSKCYAQTGWSSPLLDDPDTSQKPLLGRLMTRNDQAILVNGVSANSADTILTGSSIETPDQVGASVSLGSLGMVDFAPNTTARLDYGTEKISLTLVRGCLILHTKRRTTGRVDTSAGSAGITDPSSAGTLDVCFPLGAPSPTVNQGAAARAGAGARQGKATTAWSLTKDDMIVSLVIGIVALVIIGVAIAENPGQGINPSPTK